MTSAMRTAGRGDAERAGCYDRRMVRGERMLLIFSAILADLAGGCSGSIVGTSSGCPTYNVSERVVDAAALAQALNDDELSFHECASLCDAIWSESTSDSATTTTTTTTTADGESSTTAGETAATDATSSTTDTDTTTDATASTTDADTTTASTTAGDSAGTTYAEDFDGCDLVDAETATIGCRYLSYCVGGRRPEGLRSQGRGRGDCALGRWFAELAHLEAASVPAFERLAAHADRGGLLLRFQIDVQAGK